MPAGATLVVGAYGVGVLTRAEGEAAGAMVRPGQRPLVGELPAMLPERPAAQATGARSVSAMDDAGVISTDEGARNILCR
ncbi:hypothetical protein ACFU7T_13835 [Streptomyces sp. NPDC057555]|uniref:hypothetical protein n=1 Tax=Streptomyces sp. NPDC057555 TaxID=3346166 RepID=UPI0036AC7D0F